MKTDVAIYGSHNGSVAIAIDNKIEVVIEIERFLNKKNCGMFFYYSANIQEYLLKEVSEYIKRNYGITRYDNCISDYVIGGMEETFFPSDNYHVPGHHIEHAAGSLYQSPHSEALIFSFDGGGKDGFFNIYHGIKGQEITLLEEVKLDIGFAYMSFGDRLKDIRHEPLWLGNLTYPGKIMGLCAYGNIRSNWLEPFMEYYKSGPEGPTYDGLLKDLGSKVGEDFSNRIDGVLGYDMAATSQRAFEEVFLSYAKPWMDKYPNLPIHMTGGCALNIILNTRIGLKREVFVTPNPNDCGLAVGMLCRFLKPTEIVDITYAGIPPLDRDLLPSYCEEFNAIPIDMKVLVDDLKTGSIVGVVRGNGEHGPRALGNRSILCNPAISGMKDTLNSKVKNREWYRPFAPVVRYEELNKYFDWNQESRWMTFCPKVKPEWRETLSAITHTDGTARVQTVTLEQNPWLYNLLIEFEQATGHGVLLNTSFNIAGKPILSSFTDAIKVFNNTQLDKLLLENYYFSK